MKRPRTLLATLVALFVPHAMAASATEGAGTPGPQPASTRPVPGATMAPLPNRVLVVPAGPGGRSSLTLWFPAGSRLEPPGEPGGAAAAAQRVHTSLTRALAPSGPVHTDLTTAYARFTLPLPSAGPEAVVRRIVAAALRPGPGKPPEPLQLGWLTEAGLGPRLADDTDDALPLPGDFHQRHYRGDTAVAVLSTSEPSEGLARALSEALQAAPEPASPSPEASAPEALPAPPPTRHWACVALQGPPPGAWGEEAALVLAGEVLQTRLAGATRRPVEVALERWPTASWLVLGIAEPGPDTRALVEGQVAAMRDDLVDLVELARARVQWTTRRGDPDTDATARAFGVGYDALVTGVSEGWRQEREAIGRVGREELQAVMQRYGCGDGLRLFVSPADGSERPHPAPAP